MPMGKQAELTILLGVSSFARGVEATTCTRNRKSENMVPPHEETQSFLNPVGNSDRIGCMDLPGVDKHENHRIAFGYSGI